MNLLVAALLERWRVDEPCSFFFKIIRENSFQERDRVDHLEPLRLRIGPHVAYLVTLVLLNLKFLRFIFVDVLLFGCVGEI